MLLRGSSQNLGDRPVASVCFLADTAKGMWYSPSLSASSAVVGFVDPLPPADCGTSDACNGLPDRSVSVSICTFVPVKQMYFRFTWHNNLLPKRLAESERCLRGDSNQLTLYRAFSYRTEHGFSWLYGQARERLPGESSHRRPSILCTLPPTSLHPESIRKWRILEQRKMNTCSPPE